jgi:hypothetical protein
MHIRLLLLGPCSEPAVVHSKPVLLLLVLEVQLLSIILISRTTLLGDLARVL